MSEHAKVTSIAALEEFRTAIATFSEDVARAVMAADADVARNLRSLTHQLPFYWKSELRRREENVVKARIALEQALMSREMGKSTVEERKALAKAKEDARHAADRLEATKRWRRQLEREELIYRGSIEPLSTFAEVGAPRACYSLRTMIDRLEEYVSLQPAPLDSATEPHNPPAVDAPASPSQSMARAGTSTTPHPDLELIAARLPSPSQVEASVLAETDNVLPTPPLSPQERTRLAPLTPSPAPDARTFLLIDNTARTADRFALHRAAPVASDDSGWRVLGLDRKEPSRWTRVPIVSVLRSRSTIYDLLRLDEGWTGVLASKQAAPICAILDTKGIDHWGSMTGNRESPT